MEFSRHEYWSGLPFPSPGDLPDPGIETRSPALQAGSLPIEPKICHHVYSLKRNWDPVPLLHHYVLIAPPLFLYSLILLISSYLNPSFGTQGGSRRLKSLSYI